LTAVPDRLTFVGLSGEGAFETSDGSVEVEWFVGLVSLQTDETRLT
jgi:hypothetical protein